MVFDVRDHEIIQRVYQAAWTRLAASKPVCTPEEESLRQKFLRKRLFAIAKRGTVDFDKLYAEVMAIYERLADADKSLALTLNLHPRDGSSRSRSFSTLTHLVRTKNDRTAVPLLFLDLDKAGCGSRCYRAGKGFAVTHSQLYNKRPRQVGGASLRDVRDDVFRTTGGYYQSGLTCNFP